LRWCELRCNRFFLYTWTEGRKSAKLRQFPRPWTEKYIPYYLNKYQLFSLGTVYKWLRLFVDLSSNIQHPITQPGSRGQCAVHTVPLHNSTESCMSKNSLYNTELRFLLLFFGFQKPAQNQYVNSESLFSTVGSCYRRIFPTGYQKMYATYK
jgi:hypothetical protein